MNDFLTLIAVLVIAFGILGIAVLLLLRSVFEPMYREHEEEFFHPDLGIYKRVELKHGSAIVDPNISPETLDSLNTLADVAYKHFAEQELEDEHQDFQHCYDCDLPDACRDHGCAVNQGLKPPNF